MAYFKFSLRICLNRPRKITKHLTQNMRHYSEDGVKHKEMFFFQTRSFLLLQQLIHKGATGL